MKELIASNETLAERQLHVSKETAENLLNINDRISQGFEILSFNMMQIANSIDNLTSVCEIGLAAIVSELRSANSNLDQIKELLETIAKISASQNQYQAIEYYSNALTGVSRRMYRRALDDLECAISGYQGFRGYPYDHRFYKLRGKILLGLFEKTDSELVDIALARQSFLDASVHIDQEDVAECAQMLALAAWCSYCIGEFETAEAQYKFAVDKYDRHPGILIEYSRLLLQKGNKRRAREQFTRAMQLDPLQIRLCFDPVFIQEDEVKGWIRFIAEEKKRKICVVLGYLRNAETRNAVLCLQKHQQINSAKAQRLLEYLDKEAVAQNEDLVKLANKRAKVVPSVRALRLILRDGLRSIQQKLLTDLQRREQEYSVFCRKNRIRVLKTFLLGLCPTAIIGLVLSGFIAIGVNAADPFFPIFENLFYSSILGLGVAFGCLILFISTDVVRQLVFIRPGVDAKKRAMVKGIEELREENARVDEIASLRR